MPILRGAVSFARYLADLPDEPPADPRRWLGQGLRARAFAPLDPKDEEDRAAGFVELEDPEATSFAVGDLHFGQRALFTWRIDQRRISASHLRAEVEKWARDFEKAHGRGPARREKAERKNALRQKLRTDAVPVTKTHDVAWDLKANRLQIWSASRKVVEEIAVALEEGFGVRLRAQLPEETESLKPTAELVGPGILEENHGAA